MKIIKLLKEHIIFENADGTASIEPNTPYFRMKILEFKGDRIRYDIPIEGIEIIETFNGMIFNISLNGVTITTRPNMADEVVSSFNDTEKIYDIFDRYNNNKYNVKLLEGILSKYGERIKVNDFGFVIDNLFLVDRNGVAWNWGGKYKTIDHSTNISSGAICIVVNKTQQLRIRDSHGSIIVIDQLGYIILSKIEFLLRPNLNDTVFTNQLPKETLDILKINFSSDTNKVNIK